MIQMEYFEKPLMYECLLISLEGVVSHDCDCDCVMLIFLLAFSY